MPARTCEPGCRKKKMDHEHPDRFVLRPRCFIFLGGSSLSRLCMPASLSGFSPVVSRILQLIALGSRCFQLLLSLVLFCGMLNDGFRVRALRRRGKAISDRIHTKIKEKASLAEAQSTQRKPNLLILLNPMRKFQAGDRVRGLSISDVRSPKGKFPKCTEDDRARR